MEAVDPHQLEGLAHLLSEGYGLSALLFIILGIVAKLWMKEMRDRIDLSEKRAVIIEHNNKLIEELRDSIKELSSNIDRLMLTFNNAPSRRRSGQ